MKKQLKRISLAVPTLLLAFSTLAVAPAFASLGSDDSSESGSSVQTISNSGSGSSHTETSTSRSGRELENETETETEIHTTSVGDSDDSQTTELHRRGKALVAELRAKKGSKLSDDKREKVCEAHKQGLTNKFTVIGRNVDSYKTRIDDVYAKALAYQADKNISSGDLTTLVASANAAKETAATSIANLKAVTPSIDCNNVSVAQDVATFKTAAHQTRTDLKGYRTAVKAVVKALRDATKTATDETSTDSTNTSGGSN